MVKFIESELLHLRSEVYDMWTLVCNQMDQVRLAVLGLDSGIASQVMVRERRVDAFELKIDSDVEDFIALYTPVAVDLRFVLAMLKINNDLERIGDYADGIARFVRDSEGCLLDSSLVDNLHLNEMFTVVLEMMKGLQQAFVDEDPAKATSVMSMDDRLDTIKAASTGVFVEYARANPDSIALCMGLAGVFRKLERTGDHLTNIAEEIVFFIDAKVLKHTSGMEESGKQSD